MAQKQATVYVIDLGKDMGGKSGGRTDTDLEYAELYLWDRITNTVASGRKTDNISVIGYRTTESDNSLVKGDENYSNISILSPMSQFLMPTIRELKKRLVSSDTNSGDGISALVIAIDVIEQFCRKLKYKRNIVFLTNGTGSYDFEGIDDIVQKIKEQDINVTVLGIDFDDEDYGYKESGKTKRKAENERALKEFCEACGGVYGTLAEAIEELQQPRIKDVRPIPSFRGKLTIGDPLKIQEYALAIDVERYPRTMTAKPISASNFAMGGVHDSAGSTERESTGGASSAELQQVRVARVYQVDDDDAPGGKVDVERDELSKGYTFGRTVVPVSASDEEIVQFETHMGLEIIGFLAGESFQRYLSMSSSCVIIPSKANDKAVVALSSFIHALYELDSVALARLVTKDSKPPSLRILAPSIEADYECLVDIQVPFAEDIRHYKFAPFDHVKTLSGKVLDSHRLIPSEDLIESMSDYIDSMDMSQFEGKEETESPAYYSPLLHRINQCISWRATHPDGGKLPEIYPVLISSAKPSSQLIDESKDDLARLIELSDIKKVPPKAKGRKREAYKPLSGLDVEALIHNRIKAGRIDPENPIPEFKQLIEHLPDASTETLQGIMDQMSGITKRVISNSLSDSAYGKAISIIKTMRDECLNIEEPDLFNDFIQDLKESTLRGDLGGDRKDFFISLRSQKLGLLTAEDSLKFSKTKDDNRKFLFDLHS